MKTPHFLLFTFFVALPFLQYAQEKGTYKIHNGFESVFQEMASGTFSGSVNGVLFVKRPSTSSEIILDFQGSKAELKLETDENEVYDVSTKVYHGYTTSAKSEIKYETYAWANSISIQIGNEWYQLTCIDGACDMALAGIEWTYKAEKTAEYLVLRISKELILTNWPYINEKYKSKKEEYVKKTITLLPESTLVFAIKR
ncbi:MAG: hypothetical protein AAFY71_10350 [Bacteroidota bacterium]